MLVRIGMTSRWSVGKSSKFQQQGLQERFLTHPLLSQANWLLTLITGNFNITSTLLISTKRGCQLVCTKNISVWIIQSFVEFQFQVCVIKQIVLRMIFFFCTILIDKQVVLSQRDQPALYVMLLRQKVQ